MSIPVRGRSFRAARLLGHIPAPEALPAVQSLCATRNGCDSGTPTHARIGTRPAVTQSGSVVTAVNASWSGALATNGSTTRTARRGVNGPMNRWYGGPYASFLS